MNLSFRENKVKRTGGTRTRFYLGETDFQNVIQFIIRKHTLERYKKKKMSCHQTFLKVFFKGLNSDQIFITLIQTIGTKITLIGIPQMF